MPIIKKLKSVIIFIRFSSILKKVQIKTKTKYKHAKYQSDNIVASLVVVNSTIQNSVRNTFIQLL